ncbi:MAG: hypothetical protein HYZ45_09960 [Burkholderiales bacterium]|nr:hypothetical protein [Burkholderiales bacterium]
MAVFDLIRTMLCKCCLYSTWLALFLCQSATSQALNIPHLQQPINSADARQLMTQAKIDYSQQRPVFTLAQLDDKHSAVSANASASASIAVIYPNVGEPFRSIFTKIIEGIEDKAKVKVKAIPIESNVDAAELNVQLKRYGTKVVIALGRQGMRTAAGLDRDMTIVVGGVLTVPENESQQLTGYSFTPDPAILFTRLKTLLPESKRVFVVYDPQHNESLMKLAREEAKSHNLELVAQPARDLASAAKIYETIFSTIDNRRDAVWLPNDTTTVEENTILPLVLKLSWNSSTPIFSSNFLHVKKGALFALYPNNVELGRTLAHSALGILAGETRKRGVAPLRELHTAVNLRTASRIGINISYQQQRTFDFVFPEP